VRFPSATDPFASVEGELSLLDIGEIPHSNAAQKASLEWGSHILTHGSMLTAQSSPKDIQ